MKTFRPSRAILALLVVSVLLVSADALAQGKKSSSTAPAAADQQKSKANANAGKSAASLKDVLTQYKGQVTSIGRLKAVESDHFVVDDDGTLMIYPLSAIHSIKILKLDEENPDEAAPRLEIKIQ